MMPPARILVAVDFSVASRTALVFGARLAAQCGSELHVGHAQDPLLAAGAVRKSAAGVPFARSGNFALTYEVTANGSRYAVRCFHKESDLLERRYQAIARKLSSAAGRWFVDFDFQPAGIRTESGQYPLLRMQWAEGRSLAQFISDHRDDRAGGLLPKEDAIRLWEAASGLRADREALRWCELFSCVKGQAIWLSAAREYHDGSNRDPIMALAAWMQTNSQDRATLELLGHLP